MLKHKEVYKVVTTTNQKLEVAYNKNFNCFIGPDGSRIPLNRIHRLEVIEQRGKEV